MAEDLGYLVVTRWRFAGPRHADLARARFRAGFGPLVRAQPGCRRWYLAAAGVHELITVSVWDSAAAFAAAEPHLRAWRAAHLDHLGARVLDRRWGAVAAHAGR
jgi:hypothetical protein